MPLQYGTFRPPSPDLHPRTLHVLIVEGNVDRAETLRRFLADKGHTLEIARSGPAALEAARRKRPDVVLLDLGLPGLDGIEVAKRLRLEHGEAIRIIVITAHGSESVRQQTQEAGCGRAPVKPPAPA